MTDKRAWLYDLLLVLVLLLAGYLRLAGVDWGDGQHQHPDELFLTGVLGSLQTQTCEDPSIPLEACPPERKRWLGIAEYFDTEESTLNPHNRGFGFFVYGTLPLFIVRYSADLITSIHDALLALDPELIKIIGHSAVPDLKLFGRQFSALADLFTICLLYFIVSRVYNRRVGVLASLFSALAATQIQQSHYFTTDLFTNLFLYLAIWFAIAIVHHPKPTNAWLTETLDATRKTQLLIRILRSPLFLLSLGFGFALGMAMASKLNAVPLAILLPGAFLLRYFTVDRRPKTVEEFAVNGQRSTSSDYWSLITVCLAAGALATVISFRIFQPYAFDGIGLNPRWVANIQEQRVQASGDADLPWNLQWVRRSHLYSFVNLTVWGLGLPLGILAWAGFLLMGWRIVKGEWRHVLLWAWTAFYFLWQSLQFNPTMRYQLPIYPLLAMMAAWAVFEFARSLKLGHTYYAIRNAAYVSGGIVLVLTVAWAFAFQSIYLRDEPRVAASRWIYQNVPGPLNLRIQTDDGGLYNQPLAFPYDGVVTANAPFTANFVSNRDGMLTGVLLGHALDVSASPSTIILSLSSTENPDVVLARASAIVDSSVSSDRRGPSVSLTFDTPVPLTRSALYALKIETLGGPLTLSGSAIANETDYDWGLPFRMDGYDPFGGMYRGDLNLQVYWDDNRDKLNRFLDILSQTDYIFIPTNHQYGQITRLPERYPLTTLYYRELIGCPLDKEIIWCYRVAQPGQFAGRLGFELVKVFESYPTLGPLVINDQSAEEAFTFYDHPKVLIFKKADDFDAVKVRDILSAADLTSVVHLTPRQANNYKDLMLPAQRLAVQRAGGTWSELFDYDWIQNKYPLVGLLIWYAFIFILGLAAYPITRLALPGIRRYSYPLARIVGLSMLAWLSWMGGSVGVPYTRVTIGAAFVLITVAGLGLGWMRRETFREEWKSNRRFFVIAEILFVSFFLIDLLIRFGNPDLWHPAKGGERPMDFSYLNAVLKSTTFPPYDPWFAGGYINYYYYGFVLVGTPVKLLGIVPAIAYNFILPTIFAMTAGGAFTAAWNLLDDGRPPTDGPSSLVHRRLIGGLAASIMMVLVGNLGTIRFVFQVLQRMAAPGGIITDANIVQRWIWALKGFAMSLTGTPLPISRGDWYWFPSRVIPPGAGNEITEFPLFTFLYSDLHAHMIVLPLALLLISWALAVVKSRAHMTRAEWVAVFALGGLIIGAVYPTNLSDYYTYLGIGVSALAYTLWFHADTSQIRFITGLSPVWRKLIAVAAAVTALVAWSYLAFAPYRAWYSQAYGALDPWTAAYTPFSSYVTHWGLYLFIITAWLVWETRQWMAATPISALGKLKPYQLVIEIGLAVFLIGLLYFIFRGVSAALLALPLALWAGLLTLRPDMPDSKRLALFWIGTGLVITIMVEVVTVAGDIGRMNTVFKFYMQTWTLFAVSAGAAIGWLVNVFPWRNVFQVGLIGLLTGAFMFTVTATTDKITDRMNPAAPHSLDSMAYMKYTQHWDGNTMELVEDYNAIRWMQDNVQGSPVIVEANCSEYRWCTRFTIYTGLPGVIGWNWHQRQQRALIAPNLITDRVAEIGHFYTTMDVQKARAFLKKYQVKYIIVGQLERNVYPPSESADGLAKFEQYNGSYWRSVFREAHTVIYEVLP